MNEDSDTCTSTSSFIWDFEFWIWFFMFYFMLEGAENCWNLRVLKKKNFLGQDSQSGQSQLLPSVLAELQRRVMKAEAALRQKDSENATLQQQLKKYETRWLEYDTKMKSMEETWKRQFTSLQVSLLTVHSTLLLSKNQCAFGLRWNEHIKNNFCKTAASFSFLKIQPPVFSNVVKALVGTIPCWSWGISIILLGAPSRKKKE